MRTGAAESELSGQSAQSCLEEGPSRGQAPAQSRWETVGGPRTAECTGQGAGLSDAHQPVLGCPLLLLQVLTLSTQRTGPVGILLCVPHAIEASRKWL